MNTCKTAILSLALLLAASPVLAQTATTGTTGTTSTGAGISGSTMGTTGTTSTTGTIGTTGTGMNTSMTGGMNANMGLAGCGMTTGIGGSTTATGTVGTGTTGTGIGTGVGTGVASTTSAPGSLCGIGFTNFDTNRNSQISLDEFQRSDISSRLFQWLDINRDNFLSQTELNTATTVRQ